MNPITPTQYDHCIRLAEWLKSSDSGDGYVVMPDGEKMAFNLGVWKSRCGTMGCAVGTAAEAGVIPGLSMDGVRIPTYEGTAWHPSHEHACATEPSSGRHYACAVQTCFGGCLEPGLDRSEAPPFYLESTDARTPTAVAEELRAWAEARRPEGR